MSKRGKFAIYIYIYIYIYIENFVISYLTARLAVLLLGNSNGQMGEYLV